MIMLFGFGIGEATVHALASYLAGGGGRRLQHIGALAQPGQGVFHQRLLIVVPGSMFKTHHVRRRQRQFHQ